MNGDNLSLAELPAGYRLCYESDYVELIMPNGHTLDRLDPETPSVLLVSRAKEHEAEVEARIAELDYLLGRRRERRYCGDRYCPVCHDRGLIPKETA